jgi:adenylate kinase
MGVAGAGKSVQGQLLAKDLGYKWISTGEFLRARITGKRKEEMLAGKLLDAQEMIEHGGKFLNALSEDIYCVLDGFPRTLKQAKWLLDQHEQAIVEIEAVVHLNVSKEEVLKRLLARGRPDDVEQVITRRYNNYLATTEPIIDWLKSQNIPVFEIDGERSIDEIHTDITELLTKKKS